MTTESEDWGTATVVAPRLKQYFLNSHSAKTKVSYHVYTPPLYDTNKTKHFPTIYWLHGHGGGIFGLAKMVQYFDSAIQSGRLPPTIIVFPNGMKESMWCNSKNGKVPMENFLIHDLIPEIDSNFRTVARRTSRLIEGFSMGGYGAARLGLKYPEIFGAISVLGGGPMQKIFDAETGPINLARDRIRILNTVYGNDQSYFLAQSPWLLAENYAKTNQDKIIMRIAVGKLDAMLEPNKDFSDYLKRLKIPHDFISPSNIRHEPLSLLNSLKESNWSFYQLALQTQTYP